MAQKSDKGAALISLDNILLIGMCLCAGEYVKNCLYIYIYIYIYIKLTLLLQPNTNLSLSLFKVWSGFASFSGSMQPNLIRFEMGIDRGGWDSSWTPIRRARHAEALVNPREQRRFWSMVAPLLVMGWVMLCRYRNIYIYIYILLIGRTLLLIDTGDLIILPTQRKFMFLFRSASSTIALGHHSECSRLLPGEQQPYKAGWRRESKTQCKKASDNDVKEPAKRGLNNNTIHRRIALHGVCERDVWARLDGGGDAKPIRIHYKRGTTATTISGLVLLLAILLSLPHPFFQNLLSFLSLDGLSQVLSPHPSTLLPSISVIPTTRPGLLCFDLEHLARQMNNFTRFGESSYLKERCRRLFHSRTLFFIFLFFLTSFLMFHLHYKLLGSAFAKHGAEDVKVVCRKRTAPA
eukprot:gene3961-2824_t